MAIQIYHSKITGIYCPLLRTTFCQKETTSIGILWSASRVYIGTSWNISGLQSSKAVRWFLRYWTESGSLGEAVKEGKERFGLYLDIYLQTDKQTYKIYWGMKSYPWFLGTMVATFWDCFHASSGNIHLLGGLPERSEIAWQHYLCYNNASNHQGLQWMSRFGWI